MNSLSIWIAISVLALAAIGILVFFAGKKPDSSSLSPLAGLAFGFVVAGIVFGEDRVVGYGLMGIGVVLAVIDALRRAKIV